MKKFSKDRPLTDAEEAEIQAMIASDPDAPEATDADIAQGRPFADVFPTLSKTLRAKRGRPRLAGARQAVTLRLSPQTIARFQAQGGENWRARMIEILERAEG